MSLRDVKAKIKSVEKTRKVTRAMEAVSAVKMRKSQLRARTGRPYAAAALAIMARLAPSLATSGHLLTEERALKRIALVIVTSDKGLCGVLNAAALKEAERVISLHPELSASDIDVYAFGRKAGDYFDRRGYSVVGRYENVSDDVQVADLDSATEKLVRSFEDGTIDKVVVVYTNFKSTFEQNAVVHTLLPLSLSEFQTIVAGIDVQKGEAPAVSIPFYTVEPSPEEVLAALLPRLTSVFLYHMLLEGKASEHSARMIAMKNASDKSRDVVKSLTRTYNKVRQAVITREVSEIVGGIEAMATN